jgi:hypothetical protein
LEIGVSGVCARLSRFGVINWRRIRQIGAVWIAPPALSAETCETGTGLAGGICAMHRRGAEHGKFTESLAQ